MGDAALLAAIGLGCTLEVWASGVFGSTHMTGPRIAVYASYMISLVALAFRRRYPLGSTLVVAGSLVTEWILFGAPEGFGVFVLLIVAGYSVAAHADRRRALVGLAALTMTAVLWPVLDPADTTVADRVGAMGWMTPVLVAWLIGAYLREVRGRAAQAVRERDDRAAAAVAAERARIARELHDIVAQLRKRSSGSGCRWSLHSGGGQSGTSYRFWAAFTSVPLEMSVLSQIRRCPPWIVAVTKTPAPNTASSNTFSRSVRKRKNR